jgi:lysophospholipase L1-like esterase
MLADLPRWYLRKDLRSFDHIHPNEKGHAIIAETMCPKLPESWGCTCD